MEWQKQREYLITLFEDPQANDSEIIRIYGKIIKDTNYSPYSYDVVKFLNQKADKLLEPELCKILKELRIQSHSYLLVANNLLNLEDVKYDLLNGEVLANAIPSNTLNRLKSTLGLATAHPMQGPTNLLVEPMLQLATLSVQEKPFNSNNVSSVQQKPPTEQKESMPLVAVAHQPQQHNIRHATTSEHGNNRLAIKIKNQCKFLERLEDSNMFSHCLDLKETITFSDTDTSTIIKRFAFGEPNQLMERPCKTILFMGETGSGKTTMINAIMNYVLGVKFDDDFRFKLIHEDVEGGSQAHSQTQGVTAYDIHHQNGFRVPFSLTIVDTPGFGDTRGPERDKEITSAIQEFFKHQNGIQELDAIAFVVKSSDARLTLSQKYIFNSVLDIFGKDMGENIRFLITYADGSYPQVLAAIKEAQLPCQMDSKGSPCHHNFNNVGVYTNPSSAARTHDSISYHWNISMDNFESFFYELSGMKTTSLRMTKEVVEKRKCLENYLEFMWNGIDRQLAQIEQLRKMEEIIDQSKEKIDSNQNFEITVLVSKKVKEVIKKKQSALNCTKCQVTCHYPCTENLWTNFCPAFWEFSLASIPQTAFNIANNTSQLFGGEKEKIVKINEILLVKSVQPFDAVFEGSKLLVETGINLFTKNRTCKVCPGECPSSDHVNENQRWVYKQVEEKQTVYEMRQQYEDALGQQVTAEEKLTSLKEEMEKLETKIVQAIGDIARCSNMLKKIALRGNPLTTVEYIQLKIQNEKNEKKPGYEKRIGILQDVLKKANEQATANLNDGEEATSN